MHYVVNRKWFQKQPLSLMSDKSMTVDFADMQTVAGRFN